MRTPGRSRTPSGGWPAAIIPMPAPSRTLRSGSRKIAEAYGVLFDPGAAKSGCRQLTCGFSCGAVEVLAVSRACGSTDALPDLRPPDRIDDAAGTVGGAEGRRVAGAARRGRRATAAERPGRNWTGRTGQYSPSRPGCSPVRSDEPASDSRHAAALAPETGPVAVDLSPKGGRQPVDARVEVLIEQMARENPG
jgi:hypothetical protein